MKLNELSPASLAAERSRTDAEIVTTKASGAPEEGPILSALRKRRAELIAEISRRGVAKELVT